MKKTLKAFLKSSKLFYILYFYIGTYFLKFIGLFIKINNNRVLFVSYGGKKYDDSPKVIYEELKNNIKYKDFEFKWAFINPTDFNEVEKNNKIKIDTMKYYLYALSSKYWISNSSVQRGLIFKRKNNMNILFMHGLTALKKNNKNFKSVGKQFKMVKPECFDKVFIEGAKEEKLVLENINVEPNNLFNYGLPRNDELLKLNNKKEINKIKEKLGLSFDKKVILYAPTYREYSKTKTGKIFVEPVINISNWEKELGEKYILLVTSHYEIGNKFNIDFNNKFVKDVSNYNSINELMVISDLLITDYSNIVFDYSILEKPVFSYAYDYEEYIKKGRGLYNDIKDIYKERFIQEENKLISMINNLDYEKEKINASIIRNNFILNYGSATEKCIKEIFK